MFYELSKINRIPKLNRIVIASPAKDNGRFVSLCKQLREKYSNISISSGIEKKKGVSVHLNFSTCVKWNRLKYNRIPIEFLIKQVSPRLMRNDKRRKFEQFYEARKRFI